ncbi:helix-turn-helix domain-containing protein [Paracoccus sp. S-4012]|uniref:helix-turn-helix domain-containing protein n=1 Tax=Paracoccus sp. S-4012 TaxID=2665648 RepID=UPI0018A234B4|nr:helix-turn-helix domain-containing protein [Paracoccus sp. S-4012]
MRRVSKSELGSGSVTLPLPDIAARTGFASASTLARAFRRHYGEALGESRRGS